MAKASDVRVLEVDLDYRTDRLRTPLKFGDVVVRESTSLLVRASVENGAGGEGEGLGSMPLACEWAFPSQAVERNLKLEAMKLVAERYSKMLVEEGARGKRMHPIDWFVRFEGEVPRLARGASRELELEEELPLLAALVAISPIDAALHDGFGKANGICSYDGYGPEHMSHDLSFYLGRGFEDKYISDYIRSSYSEEMPVFHLVGGLDPLTREEAPSSLTPDGFPTSLEDWVKRDGVFCFKVKLRGDDVEWDVRRTREVAEVAASSLRELGRGEFYLSADSNEMHPSPEAVLEYLRRLRREAPEAFERVLYLEQPVSRDLAGHGLDMSEVARVKMVLADEGVTDLRSFDLAMGLGWSGVALKTCKCHSSALLLVAKAEGVGVPYSVQDLTCPGLALVHSAGLSARTNPIKGFEYNARQYLPFAFPEVQERYPEVFRVRDGVVRTGCLNGRPGLGLSAED